MKNKVLSFDQLEAVLAKMTASGESTVGSLINIVAGHSDYRVRERTMYITAKLSDVVSNNGELLLPSTQKKIGVTNYDNGNMLSKGVGQLVTGVRALFDTATGATVTPETAVVKDNAPAAFLNGELAIKQDGAGTLLSLSGSDVTNFKASTGNDADFRALGAPVLIRPEAPFNVQIALAPNAATLANIVVKVEIRVLELVSKTRA